MDNKIYGRFDPLYRARNWRFMPKDERRGRNIGQEIKDLNFQFSMLGNMSGSIIAQPLIEQLNYLPPADETSLGRIILVRLPGEINSTIYAGIKLASGEIIWQQMAEAVGLPPDTGAPTPAFTYLGNAYSNVSSSGIRGVVYGAGYIWIADGGLDTRRYNISSGAVTVPYAGFPTGTPQNMGIAFWPLGGSEWYVYVTAGSGMYRIYQPPSGSPTSASIGGLSPAGCHQANGQIYSVATGGEIYTHNPSTLAITSTARADSATQDYYAIHWSPTNARWYVSNTTSKQILVFNSSWVLQSTIAATNGSGTNQNAGITGIGSDGTLIYMCDVNNNRICLYDHSNNWVGSWAPGFTNPWDCEVVGTTIYVAEATRVSMWQRTV